jgi:hypothetical protein
MPLSIEQILEELAGNQEQFSKGVRAQEDVYLGRRPKVQPLILRCPPPEGVPPAYPFDEAYQDSEKMFHNGIIGAIAASRGGAQAVPSIRANMGCGIYPTLLGVRQTIFPDKMPWVLEHLDRAALMRMNEEDIRLSDDFKIGLEHMRYMAKRLEGTGCRIHPMDQQGPFDTAHMVFGDKIFYAMYDEPELIHHLLRLCCAAIKLGISAVLEAMPGADQTVCHYNGYAIPRAAGGIYFSEDTCTLLSAEHIAEFSMPYIAEALECFGGGYIHYCGSNPHFFEAVMGNRWVIGLNFGNPERHDMAEVLRRCAKENKVYCGRIPHTEETLREDVARAVNAARTADGRNMLILEMGCPAERREHCLEAWELAHQSTARQSNA